MYEQIIKELEKQLDTEKLNEIKTRKLHLGIFTDPCLSFMLGGKKTIESRFSRNKIAPYNTITKDDIVIVKKSSANVVAYFTIKEVLFFDLNVISISKIKTKYGKELCVDETFWDLKKDSKYATLIIIDSLNMLSPFHINKRGMQTWVKLK